MSVQAVIFNGADQPLTVGEVPARNLAPDEVRIDISACGICGSDLHMAHAPKTFGISSGSVLGHEFAGTISEVGEEVSELAIGNRVAVAPIRGCGHCTQCDAGEPAWCKDMTLIGGGYAQSTVVAARQCRPVPADVGLRDAALAEPAAVALHAVMRVPLRPGACVLILGAGPIGLLVAFWARRLGARDVVVCDLAPYQQTRALEIGATLFELSDVGLGQRLEEAGLRPDIVFECVGKPGLIDSAVSLVRPRGSVVGVGLCDEPDRFDGFAALHKEVTIAMSAFFHMSEFEAALDALRPASGANPQVLVTDFVDLNAAPEAFAKLYNKTSDCKTLICP